MLRLRISDGCWQIWSIALKGAFGLILNDSERKVFEAIAGGRTPLPDG
jgi:hypothetical protein